MPCLCYSAAGHAHLEAQKRTAKHKVHHLLSVKGSMLRTRIVGTLRLLIVGKLGGFYWCLAGVELLNVHICAD